MKRPPLKRLLTTTILLGLVCLIVEPGQALAQNPFTPCSEPWVRGDANDDGELAIDDVLALLFWMFLGNTAPPCLEQGDFNGDLQLDIADVQALLAFLFLDAPPPEGVAMQGAGTGVHPPDLYYRFAFFEGSLDAEVETYPVPNLLYIYDANAQNIVQCAAEALDEEAGTQFFFYHSDEDTQGGFSDLNLERIPLRIMINPPEFNDQEAKDYTIFVFCEDDSGQVDELEINFTAIPKEFEAAGTSPYCFKSETDDWEDICCVHPTTEERFCVQDYDGRGAYQPTAEDCNEPFDNGFVAAPYLSCDCPAGEDCTMTNEEREGDLILPKDGGSPGEDNVVVGYDGCKVKTMTILKQDSKIPKFFQKNKGWPANPLNKGKGVYDDNKPTAGDDLLGHVEGKMTFKGKDGKEQKIHDFGYGFYLYAELHPRSIPERCYEYQFIQQTVTYDAGIFVSNIKKRALRTPYLWQTKKVMKEGRLKDNYSPEWLLQKNPPRNESHDQRDSCFAGKDNWCTDGYKVPYAFKKHYKDANTPVITWWDSPGGQLNEAGGGTLKDSYMKEMTINIVDILEDDDGMNRHLCELTGINLKNLGHLQTNDQKVSLPLQPKCQCREQSWNGTKWTDKAKPKRCDQIVP